MNRRVIATFSFAALCLVGSGCAKKVAKSMPTAPEPVRAALTPASQRPSPAITSTRPAPAAITAARMPDAATRARIQELLGRIQDAFYDYDKHTLRSDAQVALQKDAHTLGDIIREYPDFKLTVEGYCDERGTEEYNLALGDARAKQAKEYLASLGVSSNQLRVISYGKDRQVCTTHDEECWQKNRRAHITQEQ